MALRPLLVATLQAALLGALSNVLSQLMAPNRDKTDMSIDWIPVLQFLLFSVVSTPPNFLWQDFLESAYPAHPAPPPPRQRRKADGAAPAHRPLSVYNTVAKFVLDQTVGAVVNTLLFSLFIHSLQAAMAPAPRIASLPGAVAYWTSSGAVDLSRVDPSAVLDASLADFWPIVYAGLRVWPAVSLLSFTVVKTVAARNLVGALAGVAWGIYMSTMAAK